MKNITKFISAAILSASAASTLTLFSNDATASSGYYTACEYEWVGSVPEAGSVHRFNFINYHRGDFQCQGPIYINGHIYAFIGQWKVWR